MNEYDAQLVNHIHLLEGIVVGCGTSFSFPQTVSPTHLFFCQKMLLSLRLVLGMMVLSIKRKVLVPIMSYVQ